jgi:hypothetical protein
MTDFEKLASQVSPELNMRVAETIREENSKMLDRLSDLDRRLTNTNFLTNGGGAVAILAFLSNHSPSLGLKLALLFFAIGVIATGVENRALLSFFGAVSKDNSRRNKEYWDDKLSLRGFAEIPPNVGRHAKWINHHAGVASQVLFAAGVISGAIAFLCGSA